MIDCRRRQRNLVTLQIEKSGYIAYREIWIDCEKRNLDTLEIEKSG